jgi:hypothetical protein
MIEHLHINAEDEKMSVKYIVGYALIMLFFHILFMLLFLKIFKLKIYRSQPYRFKLIFLFY